MALMILMQSLGLTIEFPVICKTEHHFHAQLPGYIHDKVHGLKCIIIVLPWTLLKLVEVSFGCCFRAQNGELSYVLLPTNPGIACYSGRSFTSHAWERLTKIGCSGSEV